MSEMKHTPEPWSSDWGRIRDGNCESVCQVPEGENFEGEKWKADKARMVACVNALAGIQDPEAWAQEAKEALREMSAIKRIIRDALPAEEYLDDHDTGAVVTFRRVAKMCGKPYQVDINEAAQVWANEIPAPREITPQQALDYEILSSWFAASVSSELLQYLCARYFAWKVRRKHRRYRDSRLAREWIIFYDKSHE